MGRKRKEKIDWEKKFKEDNIKDYISYAVCNAFNFGGKDEERLGHLLNVTIPSEYSATEKQDFIEQAFVHMANDKTAYSQDTPMRYVSISTLEVWWNASDKSEVKSDIFVKALRMLSKASRKRFVDKFEVVFDIIGKIKVEKISCAEMLQSRFPEVYKQFF